MKRWWPQINLDNDSTFRIVSEDGRVDNRVKQSVLVAHFQHWLKKSPSADTTLNYSTITSPVVVLRFWKARNPLEDSYLVYLKKP